MNEIVKFEQMFKKISDTNRDECSKWLRSEEYVAKGLYFHNSLWWADGEAYIARANSETLSDELIEERGGSWEYRLWAYHPEWGCMLDAEGRAWSKTSALAKLKELYEKYNF